MTGKKLNKPQEAPALRPRSRSASSEVLTESVTVVAKPNEANAENAKVQMQDVHFTKVKSPPRVNQQGITLAYEGFRINVVAKPKPLGSS